MSTITQNDGRVLPLLGLGTWQAPEPEVENAVYEAIRVGYRHIDCAFIYGNEKAVGRGIKKAIGEGLTSREELWITSKLWNCFHRPNVVADALEKSLNDLELDYLDLYLIHWPIAFREGVKMPSSGAEIYSQEDAPVEETWSAMEKLPKEKVRSIGVSNFSTDMLKRLTKHTAPAVNQVECHPYLNQADLLAYCNDQKIALTAYSPLGSAAGKDGKEAALLQDELVVNLANKYKGSTAQILIAYQLCRGVSVIPKSTNPKRIAENFGSLNINLSQEELRSLDELDCQYRFINPGSWLQGDSPWSERDLWG